MIKTIPCIMYTYIALCTSTWIENIFNSHAIHLNGDWMLDLSKTSQRFLLGHDIDQVLALFGNFSDLPDMHALSRRRTFKSGEAYAGFINAYTSSLAASSTIYWMLPRTQNNWAFFSLRRISQSCLQIAIP